jgi:hypothetical protein
MKHLIQTDVEDADVFTGKIDTLIDMLKSWKSRGVVQVVCRQSYEDVSFELHRLETEEEYQARLAKDLKQMRAKNKEEQEWEALKASQPNVVNKVKDMIRKGYT